MNKLGLWVVGFAWAVVGCGGGGGGRSTGGGGAGGAGAAGISGAAGSVGSAGSSGSGGAPGGAVGAAGSSGGSGGTDVGTPGTGGGAGAAGAGNDSNDGSIGSDSAGREAGSAEPHDFVCNELVGLWVASQWWGSFEKGVDTARWQFTFQHHGYLELFADPASQFWNNAVSSKCTTMSGTPDRVIFLPFSLTLKTLDDWHTQLTKVVETIKGKFPGVKRIELMTTLRSPDNMLCPNDMDPGTIVAPYVDQAIQAVADESGGLVGVGPKIALPDCKWWAGGTDLTGAGNTGAGQLLSQYYTAHP
jgi:hypothetical protein